MGWRRAMVTIIVVGALGLAAYVAATVFIRPTVDVTLSVDTAGRPTIVVAPGWRVDAIYSVRVWLDGDKAILWGVKAQNYAAYPLTRLVYGQVPEGAVQTFPSADVVPPAIPSGVIFYVEVHYLWDSAIPPAACGNTSTVKARLLEDGRIENLGHAVSGEGLKQ
jgi:hypothetical protein